MTGDDSRPEDLVRHVDAELQYLVPGCAINRRFVAGGVEVNTSRHAPFPVAIRDGRAIRETIRLDSHGFQLLDSVSTVKDFYDAEEVDRVYAGEVTSQIARVTGATTVVPQGWIVRASGDLDGAGSRVQPPGGEVHVDTHPSRAGIRAREVYKQHRPDGPGFNRFIFTSFWRTFSEPPQDWPLAMCDFRSVGPEEGIRQALHFVDQIPDAEAMLAPMADDDAPAGAVFHYNPEHRWWYFSRMTRDEAVLLKFHDSDHSVAWRVPHTAFPDPSFPDRQRRHSIEFRSFAFFE